MRRYIVLLVLGGLVALGGCRSSASGGFSQTDGDGDVDGDVDGDADGDVDGDADGDIDGDIDGDSDSDCPGDLESCGDDCVDTSSSPDHCGGCNDPCDEGVPCVESECDSNVRCDGGEPCPEGLYYCDLASGLCLPGCQTSDQCEDNEICDQSAHICEQFLDMSGPIFPGLPDATVERDEVLCRCFYPNLGFTSEGECLDRLIAPDIYWDCSEVALEAMESQSEETLRCEMGIIRWLVDCLEESCDDVEGAIECETTAFGNIDAGTTGLIDDCDELPDSYFETRESCILGEPSGCPDFEIGTETGDGVATGDTTQNGDDFTPSTGCYDKEGAASSDISIIFAADIQGAYYFDTSGSEFDTVLYVLDACDGDQIVCNDDWQGTFQSQVELYLDAEQEVVIIIDGWGHLSSGEFELNISGPMD